MASVFMGIGAAVAATAPKVATLLGFASGAAPATIATQAARGALSGAALGAGPAALSQTLSIGSALSSVGQGFAQRARLKTEAEFGKAEAAQELAAGASEARSFAREYAELTSDQTVAQLANGLDIGVGAPVSLRESTARQADRNISVARSNARNRSAMARLRSRGLLSEARQAMMGGLRQAGGTILDSYQLTG